MKLDPENNDGVFKALADPQRRRILTALREQELAAGAMAERLSLTPATVSHHLSLLKSAGLVRDRREGQLRIYTLNASVVEELLLLMTNLFGSKEDAAP
jgi:DNA-binding transcriptional ArsR family regulator